MNATKDNHTKTYRGRTLEEVLPKIKADLGPDAVIVRQRDGLMGGVGGFFQRQCIEVDALPPEAMRRFDAYDEDPAPEADQRPEAAAEAAAEPAANFIPDGPTEEPDEATIEGLSAPGIQEVLRQAAPFADQLKAELSTPPRREQPQVPLPAPARRPPASAEAVESALVDAGLDAKLAAEVVSETVSHLLPFASPRSLKRLVRQSLARRIPVEPAAPGRGRTVAFVGPGGSGKTLCAARLASAYAAGSDLPVICLTLRSADGGAELAELLEPAGVAVHAVESGEQARAHVAGAANHALVVVDTPPVAPGSAAEIAALGTELEALGATEVHLALPATFSGVAADELADRLRPLGIGRVALTHSDATSRIGGLLDFVIRSKLPISYVGTGSGLEPADQHQLAELVLP